MREEEAVVDVPLREIVGSLMWIANQTRPDIANAVRAVARFSHDPKPIHYKAAQKILEYLNATSDLGLTFRRDSDCLLYTSPSPRDKRQSRMPSSA